MARRARWAVFIGLISIGLMVAASNAGSTQDGSVDRTAPVLNQELSVVSQGIKQLLAGRDLDSIAVGEFTGPPQTLSSGGVEIKRVLIEELKRAGVRIDRRAALGIKGDYQDAFDEHDGRKKLALMLKVKVI